MRSPVWRACAATSWLPAAGPYHDWGFRYADADGELQWEGAQMRIIEGDYFETMGIPLLAGRTFNAGDDEDAPPVMVISETAARIAFPDRDAVGQGFYSADTVRTVVGVVPDVAYDARGSRKSKVYIPHTEFGDDRNWALVQVVKTRPVSDFCRRFGVSWTRSTRSSSSIVPGPWSRYSGATWKASSSRSP